MTVLNPIIITRTYPWRDQVGDREVVYRLMTAKDRDTILTLGREADDADLAFLRFDITVPKHVDEWIENLEKGRTVSVLAEVDGHIAGYANLHHNELTWSSHLGEVRVFVAADQRGMGIGQRLIGEMIHVAKEMRLERIVCEIALPQHRVRDMFERLGFRSDAILNNWLRAKDGTKHDLVIMSRSLIE